MAGITDLPFRQLCLLFGAGAATSEMLTSDQSLWHTEKSSLRLRGIGQQSGDFVLNNNGAEDSSRTQLIRFPAAFQTLLSRLQKNAEQTYFPSIVQIAGGDAVYLADAAKACEQLGADVIDINMGCPAKKVCKKAAGSALLRDEKLVAQILEKVRASVQQPLTLKTRTGWSADMQNGAAVAALAEKTGIDALAMHGRTRECRFKGRAQHNTVRAIKSALAIPVLANGDIQSPDDAQRVLDFTQCDAVMIGRGALGRPWLFAELATGAYSANVGTHLGGTGDTCNTTGPLSIQERLQCKFAIVQRHIHAIHQFYGEGKGVRIARKHFAWYIDALIEDHFSQPGDSVTLSNHKSGLEGDDASGDEGSKVKTKASRATLKRIELRSCENPQICNTEQAETKTISRDTASTPAQNFSIARSTSCSKVKPHPSRQLLIRDRTMRTAATVKDKAEASHMLLGRDGISDGSSKNENQEVRAKRTRSLAGDMTANSSAVSRAHHTAHSDHQLLYRLLNDFSFASNGPAVHQLRETKRLFNSSESASVQLDLISSCLHQLQSLSEELAA